MTAKVAFLFSHRIVDLTERSDLQTSYRPACEAHYRWQTEAEFVATEERKLVENAFLPLQGRLLDLGCGEGAPLRHLGAPAGATGIDLFEEKVAFARDEMKSCRFVAGSALDLPFEKNSFDHVLVRDLIHHLPDPARMIEEIDRVLAPNGRLDVLEPCRNNPLIFAHGLAIKVERGELRSTPAYLRELLKRRFPNVEMRRHQAFPIHRIVFHPELGMPSLAKSKWISSLVMGTEKIAAMAMPKAAWAYISLRATRA